SGDRTGRALSTTLRDSPTHFPGNAVQLASPRPVTSKQKQYRRFGSRTFNPDGLKDGRFVENDIRPAEAGRKRWLVIGHPDAGWRSAVFTRSSAFCRGEV